MNKEDRRKIVIPFTLEQFENTIERIKAEHHAGNLDLVGLFEIETLEYYYEKAKENEKELEKKEQLLELYRELITVKDEAISIVWFDADYFGTEMEEEAKDLEKQIKELENETIQNSTREVD